ncbi:MAG: DUF4397 domain-containing protein, partial [Planctomycetota bacterium]
TTTTTTMNAFRPIGAAALLLALLPAQDAKVTVLHGVPGLPAPVQVFANGNQLFSFDYGEQRGPLSLPAGAYQLDVRLNGSTILSTTANVAAGLDYSVIANLTAGGTPTLSAFANGLTPPTLPGARLYVRHTAQAPAVDVLLEQNGATVATIPNVVNGSSVVADVAPGTYSVRLNVAGTTTTAFGPAPVALENGNGYAVFATGVALTPSFRLQVQPVALTTRVNVVHGIPGLPAPVTVTANGSPLFSFDYRDVRSQLVVPPGTYNFGVLLNGSQVLGRTDTVGRGDDVTIVAHLNAAGSPTLSAFANDLSALPALSSRVTVRHLAQAPAVDVLVQPVNGPQITIPNLTNGTSVTTTYGIANTALRLAPAGSTTAVFGPVGFRPQINIGYQFFAVGSLAAGNFTVLSLQRDLTPAVPAEIGTTVGGWNCGPTISATPANFAYGQAFRVRASGGNANAMAIVQFGDSRTSFNGGPLPVSLAGFGAPGCFLNISCIANLMAVADNTGAVDFDFTVPRAVFGQVLPGYFQIGTMTTSNALGLQTTEWLELR